MISAGTSKLEKFLAILDVGHGNCAVLIDGAERCVFDVGQRSGLLEFLTAHGIGSVKTVFLSHADSDHIGALTGLLSSQIVEIARVVVNSDGLKGSAVWDDLAYELNRAHNAGTLQFDVSLVEGDSEKCGDTNVEIIAPSRYLAAKSPGSTDRAGRKITSNSVSAVIRVLREGKPLVVLPGDLDTTGLENLAEGNVDVRAPVLVFPHHGGRPGSGGVAAFVEGICERVKPKTVVFSIGRGRYEMPNPEVVKVLRQSVPDVRIVCTQLSEHCSKSIPKAPLDHLSDSFSLGREDQCCCGGTTLIHLDRPEELQPTRDSHVDFIKANVPTPLCLKD